MPLYTPSLAGESFRPSDAGMLAWAYDPAMAQSAVAISATFVILVRINIRTAMSVSNVVTVVTTGGTSLTSGQNFAGLYNSAGTRIATSADQASAWAGTGVMTTALTGGPFTVQPGFVWAALLANTSGTTPQFLRSTNSAVAAALNPGLTVSTARFAFATGGTSLPSSITPASNTFLGFGVWAALS